MKFFSLLYQGDVHPSTEKKVIPREEFSTLVTAHEIVEKAKEDAAELLKRTEEECERLRAQAKEEGFNEGLGFFNEHIVYLEQELKKLRHETQQSMLPLVLQASKRVVGKELELGPDTIVDIVIQALAPVTQNKTIKIYVSKEDKEILEKEKPRVKEILEQVKSFTIMERDDITPGGCVIETETGIINATLENQWRAIGAAFEKYMKQS